MTLANMIIELKDRLSTSSGTAFWTDTYLKRTLNNAQIWVAKQKPWRILQTTKYTVTIANRNYYDLPTDYLYGSVFFVKVNSVDYNFVDDVTFRDEDFDTANTFTFQGKYYFVYATPTENNLVIDLSYQKRPVTLSADSDVSLLQEELHEAILARAEYSGLKRDKRNNEALTALADAKDIIKDVWQCDQKSFRGAVNVGNVLDNHPNYSIGI